jgi:hypothetical protein
MITSIEFIIYVGSILASTSIIGAIASNGGLSGNLTRTVSGGTLTVVSSEFLIGYANMESFLSASINGSLGFSGYVLIGGLAALLLTWAGNLIEYRRMIL